MTFFHTLPRVEAVVQLALELEPAVGQHRHQRAQIVDDVADLCPRMAVLAGGRLQLEGKPTDLIASTRGKVWKKAIDHAELEQLPGQPRSDLDPAVRRQHDHPRPLRQPPGGFRAGRRRARGRLFLDPLHAPPRSLSGGPDMLLGITGFEIRYQLKNPVFWVAIAIFFLLGFGLTASENVSIGTPGAVHENAPYAIAIATAILTIFYLFVVTAFVANAIVRDETSGFAPIVRATSVTNSQIVLGRFLGGLIIAWLGYLAVPVGMAVGSSCRGSIPKPSARRSWPFTRGTSRCSRCPTSC